MIKPTANPVVERMGKAHRIMALSVKGSGSRMSDDIKYEYRSVKAVRGMENRSIDKVQKEGGGWEFVDQTQGTLQTTLNFRRRKPETSLSKAWNAFRGLPPAKQRAVALAMVVLLPLAAVGVGIAAAHDRGTVSAEKTTTNTAESGTVDETQTPSPTPTLSVQTEAVISIDNKELAAVLAVGDYCDPSIAQFAGKYQGQTIEFNGSITNMQHTDNWPFAFRHGLSV